MAGWGGGIHESHPVHQFGGPEVLELHEVPTPSPGPGQVLVRVRAAGVNPYDTYMRNGTYAVNPPLPYTPGSDAAGVVEAVGAGVAKVKPGDRVYTAKTVSGAYAEYALALESQVNLLPGKVSFAQGAGLRVLYRDGLHRLAAPRPRPPRGDRPGPRRQRRGGHRRGPVRPGDGNAGVRHGGNRAGPGTGAAGRRAPGLRPCRGGSPGGHHERPPRAAAWM